MEFSPLVGALFFSWFPFMWLHAYACDVAFPTVAAMVLETALEFMKSIRISYCF